MRPRGVTFDSKIQPNWDVPQIMIVMCHMDGTRRKLGSRISEAAGRRGGNFLTPEIAHIARRETAYREIGALMIRRGSRRTSFHLANSLQQRQDGDMKQILCS